MNKIYKVVWNNTLQCYTVVSELAKSHTKNNASKVIKATVLSSILAVTSSTYAAQVGELYFPRLKFNYKPHSTAVVLFNNRLNTM